MARSDIASTVSPTSDSRLSSATSAAIAPPSLSKEQRKQQERTATSLAFLNRIENVTITGSKYHDEREHLLFDVTVKDHDKHAAALGSKKAIEKEALKVQPTVNYSNMKALSTLAGVHKAVCDWSSKHHPGSDCAYCSQFNSLEALQLWTFDESKGKFNDSGAVVLAQLEKYLNEYLEWTRNAPEGISESECEGYAHIPSLAAALLQNESYNSVALDVAVLRLSSIHQLAFVLETQWRMVQSKLVLWVVFSMQIMVEHFGSDYSFQFKWLHETPSPP